MDLAERHPEDDRPDNATGYAMHSSRSHDAVIRVYDLVGNVIAFAVNSPDAGPGAEQRLLCGYDHRTNFPPPIVAASFL
jgi:hypothetical protein